VFITVLNGFVTQAIVEAQAFSAAEAHATIRVDEVFQQH
jgi:hypothetical protein